MSEKAPVQTAQPPSSETAILPTMKVVNSLLTPYQKAAWKPALLQLLNSVLPYLALLGLMILSLRVSYWLTLLLAVPASAFMIRTFILFHDCGHNSFTPSVKANKRIGFVLGVLTLTPGEEWWHAHAIHHATSSNLDRRGVGDVTTWTVDEYKTRGRLARLGYWIFRFPPVTFGLGPLSMFLIVNRLPIPRFGRRETLSVVWTNLALVAWGVLFSLLAGGFWNWIMIQLPVIWLAGLIGIWLFYVQHQFDGAYWAHDQDWNFVAAGLKGASYYKLPKFLQWVTGNIGYHHIHHLSPRIPNYRLEACYRSSPLFQRPEIEISFVESLKTARLRLVDEAHNNRMVTFKEI